MSRVGDHTGDLSINQSANTTEASNRAAGLTSRSTIDGGSSNHAAARDGLVPAADGSTAAGSGVGGYQTTTISTQSSDAPIVPPPQSTPLAQSTHGPSPAGSRQEMGKSGPGPKNNK